MSTETHFAFDLPESRRIKSKDLIKLKPFGITLVPDPQRPLLILKDASGELSLPVALNPLEAGVMLTQFNRQSSSPSPHKITERLFSSLDMKIEKCVFVEIKGHFQYVRLYIRNHPQMKSIKVRADEAMSLCLHLNVEIFATQEFMNSSRSMNIHSQIAAQDLKIITAERGAIH